MGIKNKIKDFFKNRKRTIEQREFALREKRKLEKTGLREQIKYLRKGKQGRVWKNAAGEFFLVQRKKPYKNHEQYKIFVKPLKSSSLKARGLFIIDPPKKEIRINSIKIEGHSVKSNKKKGRGIVDVFLDEAKQIGIKHFKGKEYKITLIPESGYLKEFYKKKGFVKDEGTISGMKLIIPKRERK